MRFPACGRAHDMELATTKSVPTPEYAAEKGRGRNDIRGERRQKSREKSRVVKTANNRFLSYPYPHQRALHRRANTVHGIACIFTLLQNTSRNGETEQAHI